MRLIIFVSMALLLRKPLLVGLMVVFPSLGPMTIERSYTTIYSQAEMTDSSTEVYSAEKIKDQFINGFVEGANESQKRIDEQVSIGNLEKVDGGYKITEKGNA